MFKSLVEGRKDYPTNMYEYDENIGEEKRVSWGQALWRKVKELGLTDHWCNLPTYCDWRADK